MRTTLVEPEYSEAASSMLRGATIAFWLLVVVLLLDMEISWFSTCYATRQPTGNQIAVANCIGHGPIFTSLAWLASVVDEHTEAVIAAFTGVLAISTIGLWWATRALWKAGEKQIAVAQQSADAATRSAEAAIKLELPIIRVVPPDLCRTENREPFRGGVVLTGPELSRLSRLVRIEFVNRGRTHAFPKCIGLGSQVTKGLIQGPIYTWKLLIEPDRQIRSQDDITLDIPDFFVELTDTERAEIKTGATYLWLFGFLTYTDFMDDPHEVRFCWRWDAADRLMHPHRFFTDPSTPQEYICKT